MSYVIYMDSKQIKKEIAAAKKQYLTLSGEEQSAMAMRLLDLVDALNAAKRAERAR